MKDNQMHTSERIDEAGTDFSPELIGEKIKANLQILRAQISTMTQLKNKLIYVRISAQGRARNFQNPAINVINDRGILARHWSCASLRIVLL